MVSSRVRNGTQAYRFHILSSSPPTLLSSKRWLNNHKPYINAQGTLFIVSCFRPLTSPTWKRHCSMARWAALVIHWDSSQTLLPLPLLLALIILCSSNSFRKKKKKKKPCFYKGRKLKICIGWFFHNPYKNACLERILIKCLLEVFNRCNHLVSVPTATQDVNSSLELLAFTLTPSEILLTNFSPCWN